MPIKSFGQYLLEQGLITEKMLIEALDYQRSSVRPVCDTAVKSGRTSRENLAKLHAKAGGGAPEKEEALREQIQSLEELEASWRTLSERGVFLVEALSNKGYLSRDRLDALWKEYRQKATAPAIDLEHVLPHSPETRKILEALIEIALDLFMHFTGETPELVSITRALGEIHEDCRAFTQKISGDINIQYVLLLPPRLLCSLASRMLQENLAAVDQAALDAILEFLNTVVGNTCTKFSMRNYSVQAGPPQGMTVQDLQTFLPSKPIIVRARVPDGEFHLVYLDV
ncbi:MAG: chemotaxis protein CheX [Kiritimatiellae bacterium]|nr:chemotaxis protein CheX [Kiritimatiellia bacterium]